MPHIEAIKDIVIGLFALAGTLTSTLLWWRQRRDKLVAETRKVNAETERTTIDAARALIDEMQEERVDLRKERDSWRLRQNNLVGHIATLEHKLDDALAKVRKLEEQVSLLLQENARLKVRITDLEGQVTRWRRAYESLCEWVRGRGLEPPGNGGGE